MDGEFAGRGKGAQNHVEYDPGQRKPASPVAASEHEYSDNNRQQLRQFGPDAVLLQRQQWAEVVSKADGAYHQIHASKNGHRDRTPRCIHGSISSTASLGSRSWACSGKIAPDSRSARMVAT